MFKDLERARQWRKDYYQKTKDKSSVYAKEYRSKNGDRLRDQEHQWRGKNPDHLASYREKNKDRIKDAQLRRDYGIGLDEYLIMFEEQGGLCAICFSPPGDKALCVDHDHSTGEVRGLLCRACNVSLGGFRDNTDLLMNAIDYLSRHQNNSEE